MKKPVLLIITAVIAVCIILVSIFLFSKDFPKSPHFVGNINLSIYDKEVVLTNEICNFEVVQGDGIEGKKLTIKDGRLTINRGVYAGPKIKMYLKPEFTKNSIDESLDKGVTVTFGVFQNTSLKNELNLDVIFKMDANGNPTLKVIQNVTGDINQNNENQYNYDILANESRHAEINLFTGP